MKKILVFDIETAPMLAYVWGTREENIGLNQIHADWHVIAWAAKWLGDPASKVMYFDQRNAKRIENDREILKPLWQLLDEADIVVTQNGKNFDSPKLNARFIAHGMNPPSPYKHLDTYQIARSAMRFTSNKLEYLTEKLNVKYKKLSHKKFPGFELWKECLRGNQTAWNEMRKYNKHDVLATEELYMKLRPWTPQNAVAVTDDRGACKACGSSHLIKGGTERTTATLWMRLKCQNCGKWQRGAKIKGGV
jgi:uncharacterized protein YprB with RNaseH-like and TPR domain